MRISYGKNVYDKKEINAVLNTLKKSTQMGVSVSNFEKKIAKLSSKKYGLMVNSGSSALILALKILNFPKDSSLNLNKLVTFLLNKNRTPKQIG